MFLLLLACIPSPTDLPTSDWQIEPVLLPPTNLGSTGSGIQAPGDINGDGYDDDLIGDCSANSVSLYYGSANGISSTADWTDSGGSSFGCSLTTVGDVNGPTLRQTWTGAPGEQLGTGVFALGDLNGDGFDDIGISAWIREDATTDGLDRLDVYYGAANGPATTADWSWQHQTAAGTSMYLNTGLVATSLDQNGDGYGDLVIGGTWEDSSWNPNHFSWFSGSNTGISAASASYNTYLTEARLGLDAADLDGDGRDEVLAIGYEFLYSLNSNGNLTELAGPVSSFFPVDLDGNGTDEIALVFLDLTSNGQAPRYALAAYQQGSLVPFLGSSAASVLVPLGNVNGDSNLDFALWDGTLSLWYGSSDADGDGFEYDGSATFGQDCDDQNAAINPGAIDSLGDNVDSDCDGLDGLSSSASSTCLSFSTPAEAKLLLNPDNLPLPDFSSLEAQADACGENQDFSDSYLCEPSGIHCASVASSWTRSACTVAADGVDADGMFYSADESSNNNSTGNDDSGNFRELRALRVAVDPSTGADPYAGTEVDVEGGSTHSFWFEDDSLSREGLSHSYHRSTHGNALRQDGSTQVYRLSYGTSDTYEGSVNWTWSSSDSSSSESLYLDFEQDGCSLNGNLSTSSTILWGELYGHSYEASVTDGVHSLKVQNRSDLEVCGANFWELLGVQSGYLQDEVGWADLDGAGTVVDLDTWQAAAGDNDGDGWPSNLGDCDDSNADINPCAIDAGGVDLNCDGQLGGTTPTVDNDGDGDVAGADCNDMDPTIFHGATELVGDEVDSNCDGLEFCHADSDHDGHGDANTLLNSADSDCADMGESYNDDDCKDSDPMVHPGSFDVPGNGVDDDCDGIEN